MLNFEARGSSGPVFMFETSAGNDRLIRGLRSAAPRPLAISLSYEVYRRMPNDTDLSITKAAGLPGLNFAFVDGFTDYHTMGDLPRQLDRRSLQHGGGYALALAEHFGRLDLDDLASGNDAVYFNLLGFALVRRASARLSRTKPASSSLRSPSSPPDLWSCWRSAAPSAGHMP